MEEHAACQVLKHPIDHTDVKVHMLIEAGVEPVNEGYCTNVQDCAVYICRTGAVGRQALRNYPQEDAQHYIQHRPVAPHEVTQPLRD